MAPLNYYEDSIHRVQDARFKRVRRHFIVENECSIFTLRTLGSHFSFSLIVLIGDAGIDCFKNKPSPFVYSLEVVYIFQFSEYSPFQVRRGENTTPEAPGDA